MLKLWELNYSRFRAVPCLTFSTLAPRQVHHLFQNLKLENEEYPSKKSFKFGKSEITSDHLILINLVTWDKSPSSTLAGVEKPASRHWVEQEIGFNVVLLDLLRKKNNCTPGKKTVRSSFRLLKKRKIINSDDNSRSTANNNNNNNNNNNGKK